ncbi:hypothetical protein KIN20_025674 [Parelaphostrongylus tenuis]|uniref:Uncharacterized protein n=1 Tax=Parelaphostrongylus tenuis TaxID=148309 RepID=A0AAD5MZQ3_PARTN|nr:hypothetical protein KIN20_025674 [Parelaphostrongylus tenuis]
MPLANGVKSKLLCSCYKPKGRQKSNGDQGNDVYEVRGKEEPREPLRKPQHESDKDGMAQRCETNVLTEKVTTPIIDEVASNQVCP